MQSDGSAPPPVRSGTAILKRFLHLLSAQGAEGLLSAVFLIYLARMDTVVFGEIMYAMAAGGIVMKVIQFGLYYPLVSYLGSVKKDQAPELLSRVNVIKLGLLGPCMLTILGTALIRGLSPRMSLILFLICLGFAVEQIAETYFADFRVRGLQSREARIKIAGAVLSYGYGFVTALMGFDPILISLFKLISGLIRLGFGMASYLKDYAVRFLVRSKWPDVWFMFRAAMVFAFIEILGVIYNKANIFFLEKYTGVTGVAFYSATYNVVDPISVLASEQLLGWVVFPLLAALWSKNRDTAARLVRNSALWLMAIAFPIMFTLHVESDFIITLIYGAKFHDAVWMQHYLVWTILLSFENNLFSYVMMVAGGAPVLFAFAAVTTILNLVFNLTLVPSFGLAGGCLVLVLTKLVMTIMTFVYCRIRFAFVRTRDFIFPAALGLLLVGTYLLLEPVAPFRVASSIALALYFVILWKFGVKFLGHLSRKTDQNGKSANNPDSPR